MKQSSFKNLYSDPQACGVTLDLDEASYVDLDVDDVVKEMLSKAKQVSFHA